MDGVFEERLIFGFSRPFSQEDGEILEVSRERRDNGGEDRGGCPNMYLARRQYLNLMATSYKMSG